MDFYQYIFMLHLFCYLSLFVGGCRRVKFVSPVNGHYLKGHVFMNLTIEIYASCEHRYVMESECVSVNIGPPVNDKVVCELSNSDHLRHPEDLKPRHGWTYTGTEVRHAIILNQETAGHTKAKR